MNTPRALFSCSNQYCAEENSYHASQLNWYAPEQRWVCENCWDDLPPDSNDEPPLRGISLSEHLLKNRPTIETLI